MAALVAETQHGWQINRPKTKTSPLSPGPHGDPTFCMCKSNMTAGTHDHSMTSDPDPSGGGHPGWHQGCLKTNYGFQLESQQSRG